MHPTVPSGKCWTEVDFEVASDICMDVVAEFVAQADILEKLAKKEHDEERERLLKLKEDAQSDAHWFLLEAQFAKSGSVRVCERAFSDYGILLEELEEKNSRGQIHHERKTPTFQPV